ncbi:DUF6894 family protein [Microvirga splendida]|uniref:DUF6894 family protein n=1 Tax=Microvirga splendida TaxID=2795727 RepID=UPI003CCF2BAD
METEPRHAHGPTVPRSLPVPVWTGEGPMPTGRARPPDAGGGTRCFFHLVKGEVVLTDDVGVDAADIGNASAQVLTALCDLRAAVPDAEDDWHGWSLEILDCTGHLLGTISLDEPGAGMGVPQGQRQYA